MGQPAGPVDRPRVALVAHGIHDHGGMERAFAELVRHAHHDFHIVVVAPDLAPELRPLVEWERVRVPARPIPLRFVWFFVAGGLRVRRSRADIVHTMGAIVPNRCDIATVQFCHAGYREATGALAPPDAPRLRRLNTTVARLLALAAERWCYRSGRARVLAAVSEGVGRELRSHYPGPRVAVTPNGVDADRFRPDAAARRGLREAEAVGDEEIVALFVGGDWDRKGLAIAIEALALTEARLRLWVVGQGDDRRFAALARAYGVADRIRFFGPRHDTERYYQAADVFVFPTLYEAFPLVALEAAASGLAIVATPVNGVEEIVGDDAGFLVRREADAVASALSELAADADACRRTGAAARRRCAEYSWSDVVGRVLVLYAELVAGESGRRPA